MASRTKRKKPPGRPRRELTFQRRKVVELEDGTVGYAMMSGRADDCFRAAIATALQVPAAKVPDPDIDRRLFAGHDPETVRTQSWARMLEWLDGRGVRLTYHETVPVASARWIGVVSGVLSERATAAALDDAMETRSDRRAIHRSGQDVIALSKRYFADHCLVMSYDQVLFDPAVGLDVPPGHTLPRMRLADVTYGFSFESTTHKEN